MATTSAPLMQTEQLNRLARMLTSGAVPEQYRQSLPMPVLRNNTIALALFYCPSRFAPGQPVQLQAPRYRLFLNPFTGVLEELKAVTGRDFGLGDPGEAPIGSFGLPQGMTADDYMGKLERLFTLYDQLLPLFGGTPPPKSHYLKKIGDEFHQLFNELSEPPLLPYYQVLGKDFFTWLDRLRQ